MKEKKKNLILIIVVAVINLSLVGLLIYGIVQRNIKSDTDQPNDSNPPETITPSNSTTDTDETEGIVPPITPSDPTDKTEESEKAAAGDRDPGAVPGGVPESVPGPGRWEFCPAGTLHGSGCPHG